MYTDHEHRRPFVARGPEDAQQPPAERRRRGERGGVDHVQPQEPERHRPWLRESPRRSHRVRSCGACRILRSGGVFSDDPFHVDGTSGEVPPRGRRRLDKPLTFLWSDSLYGCHVGHHGREPRALEALNSRGRHDGRHPSLTAARTRDSRAALPSSPSAPTRERLLSLDVFRGMTVAGMLLVNNPGTWGAIYPPLEHAEWNGWTPTDLIFPFFLFIVGITTYLSLGARRARGDDEHAIRAQIIRRGALIFLFGLLINGFPYFTWGDVAGVADPRSSSAWATACSTGASWACSSASASPTWCAALLTLRTTTLKQQIVIIAVAAVRLLVRDDRAARARRGDDRRAPARRAAAHDGRVGRPARARLEPRRGSAITSGARA